MAYNLGCLIKKKADYIVPDFDHLKSFISQALSLQNCDSVDLYLVDCNKNDEGNLILHDIKIDVNCFKEIIQQNRWSISLFEFNEFLTPTDFSCAFEDDSYQLLTFTSPSLVQDLILPLQLFQNDKSYIGNIILSNGETFIGEFQNLQFSKGTYTNRYQTSYKGEFINSRKLNGLGLKTDFKGQNLSTYLNGLEDGFCCTYIPTGDFTKGIMTKDGLNGISQFKIMGKYFIGEFVNHFLTGFGYMNSLDVQTYGEHISHRLSGIGKKY
jgi:hypothetical protein